MTEISNEEILNLITTRGLTIEKMIDTMVDAGEVEGERLRILATTLYYYTLHNSKLRKPGITPEEINAIMGEVLRPPSRAN